MKVSFIPWDGMGPETETPNVLMHVEIYATCQSSRCKGETKAVPKDTIDCPQCKSALLWVRRGKEKRPEVSTGVSKKVRKQMPVGTGRVKGRPGKKLGPRDGGKGKVAHQTRKKKEA